MNSLDASARCAWKRASSRCNASWCACHAIIAPNTIAATNTPAASASGSRWRAANLRMRYERGGRTRDHRLIGQCRRMSAASSAGEPYRRLRSFSSALSTIQSRSPARRAASCRDVRPRFVALCCGSGAATRMRALGAAGSCVSSSCTSSGRRRIRIRGLERQRAGEQLVQHDAERIDVRARVDIERRELRLLRAHVLRRADQVTDHRVRAARLLVERHGLGDAEVDHLGARPAVDLRDQQVAGLEVAMDHALLVRVLHGLADRA